MAECGPGVSFLIGAPAAPVRGAGRRDHAFTSTIITIRMVTVPEGLKRCISSGTIDRDHRVQLAAVPEITRPLTVGRRPIFSAQVCSGCEATSAPAASSFAREARLPRARSGRHPEGVLRRLLYWCDDAVRCWRRESGRRERASLSSPAALNGGTSVAALFSKRGRNSEQWAAALFVQPPRAVVRKGHRAGLLVCSQE